MGTFWFYRSTLLTNAEANFLVRTCICERRSDGICSLGNRYQWVRIIKHDGMRCIGKELSK